ncbi:MAG TPA: hypothetical protein PL073_13625, partial [Spirochaetota bacterium]|nr:hypothetical protein [Spirochaetota bacterium]
LTVSIRQHSIRKNKKCIAVFISLFGIRYCMNVYSEMNFFSSMISKTRLGEIISIANRENSYTEKAEKFLLLIQH